MSGANNSRLVLTRAVLWLVVGIAAVVAVNRFARGLGATTALTDATPWGLWIGFDVLAGVALAAGGFVIAATVYIFHLDRYHAIVRPAVLTAFLGYVAVVLGLLMDLGRPWNIWRPMLFWQPHSPLFEVAWCVMLYLTVLALEFAPVVFEGLRLERPLRIMRRLTLLLVIAGIGLSTLHQSSLGTLFLLARDRLHPLWYSPILPLLFLVSAVALGLMMVTCESLASSWLFRHRPEWPLLGGLTRAAAVVSLLYLALRLGDLAWRHQLVYLLEGSWASVLFVFEIGISAVVPALLFLLPSTRTSHAGVATGAVLGVGGFVLYRADVGGIAHLAVGGHHYVPALTEIVVSAGVVSAMALVFLFLVERFPVWEERPQVPGHFTAPMRDRVTGTFFGGPWFSRAHLGAAGLALGMVLGVALVEADAPTSAAARLRPVPAARTALIREVKRNPSPGHRLEVLSPEQVTQDPDGIEAALLVGGGRNGRVVLFPHQAHQQRLGGPASCGKCHHRNLRHDRGTPCTACHRDMYAATDTFAHQPHVEGLGGNASCTKCHQAGTAPARASARACDAPACHGGDVSTAAVAINRSKLPAGYAPGYRRAMHTLCIGCHTRHEQKTKVTTPYLSRCTTCHRDRAVEPEPATVVVARLEAP
ncbi:MAG: Ni/Fe-hydrogenase cytochrome b subunit [Acidobacteria bacterium]|nr:Ni/Fe-hydrogenase cytochrome b subunit [Acidobacteriota bacterium]